jgi:predicted HD phosphohydrolase
VRGCLSVSVTGATHATLLASAEKQGTSMRTIVAALAEDIANMSPEQGAARRVTQARNAARTRWAPRTP